jgi:site-specific recombinase XerD
MVARRPDEPAAEPPFSPPSVDARPVGGGGQVSLRERRRETAASEGRSGRKVEGKPYKSFPLTPHRSGQFCKKIRGKIHYFGTIADPEAALRRYHEHAKGLHAGEIDRVDRSGELTIAELANQFLAAKERKRANGDIEAATFVEYHRDCELLVQHFGRQRTVPSMTRRDLAGFRQFLGKGVNATTLNNRIGNARSIFKFAYDHELIDRPVRFGEDFKRPEKRLLRRARAEAGRMHFHAEEVRSLLEQSPAVLRAMVLLGINCGLGNTDVGNLPASCVDLERGWIDYARVKTGVQRRCPLWPETVAAIRLATQEIARHRRPREASAKGLLFVTRMGHPYTREEFHSSRNGKPHVVLHDAVADAMQKAMRRAGISLRGLGFYGLRRSFETIGAETGNQVAVDHIMGHVPATSDMGAVYRQHVAERALRQVTDHVRTWLFGAGDADGSEAAAGNGVRSTHAPPKKTSARSAGKRVAAAKSGRDPGRSDAPGKPAGRSAGS